MAVKPLQCKDESIEVQHKVEFHYFFSFISIHKGLLLVYHVLSLSYYYRK